MENYRHVYKMVKVSSSGYHSLTKDFNKAGMSQEHLLSNVLISPGGTTTTTTQTTQNTNTNIAQQQQIEPHHTAQSATATTTTTTAIASATPSALATTSTQMPPQNTSIQIKSNHSSANEEKRAKDSGKETNDEDDDELEDEEDENEVVEVSTVDNGRWLKRRQPVQQRVVAAIDNAYVAMDTENGFEVVWNEIQISQKKFQNIEPSLERVFTNLLNINHPNIVKFHAYWPDQSENFHRIVFITEYMPTGSLKQFLRKAKRTNQPVKKVTWRRWCIQLLTALHYLHHFDPPVIHRELTSDAIFIQQNGLIKIGSIAPDIVHQHVKTRDNQNWSKALQYMAPELLNSETAQKHHYGTPVDIYSFGIIALETFNVEFGGNGDSHHVHSVDDALSSLEKDQQDFVKMCIDPNPEKRPTAIELLRHPLLFDYSLKYLATHQLVSSFYLSKEFNAEDLIEEFQQRNKNKEEGLSACMIRCGELVVQKCNINKYQEFLEKYSENLKSGLYPLTNYIVSPDAKNKETLNLTTQQLMQNQGNSSGKQSPVSLMNSDSVNSDMSKLEVEKRRAKNLVSNVKAQNEAAEYKISIKMKFEDHTTRHLEATLDKNDTANALADDLISNGLINEVNREDLILVLEDSLKIRDGIEEKDDTSHHVQVILNVNSLHQVVQSHCSSHSNAADTSTTLSDCSMSSGCSSTCYNINASVQNNATNLAANATNLFNGTATATETNSKMMITECEHQLNYSISKLII